MAKITAQYIWIDGQKPTAKLRSKTKVIDQVKKLEDIPDWGYDGSSTFQATGHHSDLQLKPVRYVPDPLHRENDILVLCEVLNADGSVHWSNTRARTRSGCAARRRPPAPRPSVPTTARQTFSP